MAIDILSIPAMSADPERLFSGAKITITDRRNRLGIRTIQALECLKSWLNIIELQEDDAADEDELLEKRGGSSDVVEGVEGWNYTVYRHIAEIYCINTISNLLIHIDIILRYHIAIYIKGGHIAPYYIVHIVFHTANS